MIFNLTALNPSRTTPPSHRNSHPRLNPHRNNNNHNHKSNRNNSGWKTQPNLVAPLRSVSRVKTPTKSRSLSPQTMFVYMATYIHSIIHQEHHPNWQSFPSTARLSLRLPIPLSYIFLQEPYSLSQNFVSACIEREMKT